MSKALQWYLFACLCVGFGITLMAAISYFQTAGNDFTFEVWGNSVGEGWLELLGMVFSLPGLLYMCFNIPSRLGIEKKESEAGT